MHDHDHTAWARRRAGLMLAALGPAPVRRALGTRLVAIVVAVAVLLAVAGRVRDADRTRQRWGTTASVWVATRDLSAGATITPQDVELRDWPASLLPEAAVTELPADRRLRTAVGAGEVLVSHRMGSAGVGEWATMLGPDEVAVQVPLAAALSGASPGDRVDVVAPASGPLPEVTAGLVVELVARDARLLGLDATHATLAVHPSQADATAGAALVGPVALVVRP